MNRFIYDRAAWPRFTWDIEVLATPMAEVRHMQGRFVGRMEGLRDSLQAEAVLNTLTDDVCRSNEIEGMVFDEDHVRTALSKKLGIKNKKKMPEDPALEGAVDVVIDATQNYNEPMTKERLMSWQQQLFPTGFNGANRVKTGAWRTPRQGEIVSSRVDREVKTFLDWFNNDDGTDGTIRAGMAHLWFITIGPFEAGNGQIARALSDMMLARTEKTNMRFYSLSTLLRADQASYFDTLERTQKGNLDITGWMAWFLLCLSRAIEGAKLAQDQVFQKARFWDEHAMTSFNPRQRKVIDKLLAGDDKPLTSSSWARTTKCSQDTALRDIQALMDLGILEKDAAGGRSTKYYLAA